LQHWNTNGINDKSKKGKKENVIWNKKSYLPFSEQGKNLVKPPKGYGKEVRITPRRIRGKWYFFIAGS
jgi:hypothetical protein